MTIRAAITGTGSALPARRVSNAELAEQVDTTDEWIVERTGIRFRHIAAPGRDDRDAGRRRRARPRWPRRVWRPPTST